MYWKKFIYFVVSLITSGLVFYLSLAVVGIPYLAIVVVFLPGIAGVITYRLLSKQYKLIVAILIGLLIYVVPFIYGIYDIETCPESGCEEGLGIVLLIWLMFGWINIISAVATHFIGSLVEINRKKRSPNP